MQVESLRREKTKYLRDSDIEKIVETYKDREGLRDTHILLLSKR